MDHRTRVLSRPLQRAATATRPTGGRLSRAWALALAMLAVAAGLLVGAPTAHADNTPVQADPSNGAVLETSPEQISITFLEPLGNSSTIGITCDDFIEVAPTEISDDDLTMSVQIDPPLPRGACVATWSAANLRNEGNGTGVISFSIQNDAAGVDTGDESESGDEAAEETVTTVITTIPPVVPADGEIVVTSLSNVDQGRGPLWLGRLVSIVGIAVLFGALFLIATCWPEGVEYLVTAKFVRTVWLIALGGTVLYVAAATAAATGRSFGGGFSPAAWGDLFDAGAAGRAALARLFLVAASGWVALRPDRVLLPSTQLGALALPGLAVATLGFSRTDVGSLALGAALAIVHALAMAIWLGGTVTLARVVLAGSGDEDLVHAVNSFGRTSMWAIGATVVTGVIQMIRLADGQLFGTSHGRVVVFKVVFVAAMVFIGITARQVAAQRLARASELTPSNADRLKRAFSTEAGIGTITLAMSAWLLALTPAGVDLSPQVDYSIEKRLQVEDVNFDVRVSLTNDTVGNNGLFVEVRGPESGLANLEIVFSAPPNDEIAQIIQPIPLSGPGSAVRAEAFGLPMTASGNWSVLARATTDVGVVATEAQGFTITELDGTITEAPLTVPPSSLVVIDPDAEDADN